MKKVVVFGTSDFGRLAYVYLSKDSPHEVAAFTLNEDYITEKTIMGLDVAPFENIEEAYPPDRYSIFVAVGYKRVNKARAEIYNACKQKGYELISYINSKAIHWDEIEVGDNCFIFENNVIQPFVKIGNNVVIWSGNHIGHDSTIQDHCFIASHAVISGNVTIGPYCFIGVNATFRDGVKVAPECVIGAGALILRDTKPREVYAGCHTEPKDMLSTDLKNI
ncbi:MAG: acetyltransferase [Candidatus Hodarchaeota archaeon]